MGLDQYIYISKEELEEDYYEVLGEATENEYGDVFYDEESVLTEIAYFRKSNWLHGYFDRLCEERTGHGIEDCEYFVFSKHDLHTLLEIARDVIATDSIAYAEDWLPPQSGFFFGSTAIDDYYFEDLQDFVDTMEKWEDSDEQFVYYAWW